MKPSPLQVDRIRSMWQQRMPPLQVAKLLRLVPITVIQEYVRLDELSNQTKE